MNRPFLVHLTLWTFGLASTEHCRVAEESLSTRRGFSGPTSTRGKSETIESAFLNDEITQRAAILAFKRSGDRVQSGIL